MTQLKIAELFGVQEAAISKHIKNNFRLVNSSTMQRLPKWKQFRTREYAGRLAFAVAKMGAEIILGFLDSIHMAITERRKYTKPSIGKPITNCDWFGRGYFEMPKWQFKMTICLTLPTESQ